MNPALSVFDSLPLSERLFVRARLFSAPLEELARQTPQGRVLDLGCGHGVLTALLAWKQPRRELVSIDLDERKIAHARNSIGRLPNVRVENCAHGALLPVEAKSFDAVVIADVLYLVPQSRWPSFFADVRALLKPGGLLLLKECEDDHSWRAAKCLAQEQVMVRLMRKTRTDGALVLPDRAAMTTAVGTAGFELVGVTQLSSGYTSPHLLVVARSV